MVVSGVVGCVVTQTGTSPNLGSNRNRKIRRHVRKTYSSTKMVDPWLTPNKKIPSNHENDSEEDDNDDGHDISETETHALVQMAHYLERHTSTTWTAEDKGMKEQHNTCLSWPQTNHGEEKPKLEAASIFSPRSSYEQRLLQYFGAYAQSEA